MQSQFRTLYWIARVFFYVGDPKHFPEIECLEIIMYMLRVRACFVFGNDFLGLLVSADDGNLPGDFDSRAEMSVRVWKGDFIVKTIRH